MCVLIVVGGFLLFRPSVMPTEPKMFILPILDPDYTGIIQTRGNKHTGATTW
jgi:hypothetical protein